jgi:hypothetical protein
LVIAMRDWHILRLAQNQVDDLLSQEYELNKKIEELKAKRLELELGLCAAFDRVMKKAA